MKKHQSHFLVLLGFMFLGCTPENNKITLWMIGDSTMSIKAENKFPETGWGVPFSQFFDENIHIENRAMNGRSTQSFIVEERWQSVYDSLQRGDYIFIQFGHNDEKIDKPGIGTPIVDYKANLTFFVEQVREKQAIPILLTPIARRKFEKGELVDTHGAYPQAVREVAENLAVTLIDMTTLTNELLRNLGEEESVKLFLHADSGHVNYPNGVVDNTHLNDYGAIVIADIVIQEIKNKSLPLSQYINKK